MGPLELTESASFDCRYQQDVAKPGMASALGAEHRGFKSLRPDQNEGRYGRNPSDRILTRKWRAVLSQDPCVYCGALAQGLDHIVAESQGGTDGWGNRAPACTRCDQIKSNIPLLIFIMMSERARRRIEWRCRMGRFPDNAKLAAWYCSVSSMVTQYRVEHMLDQH